jgi:hypothetical protein
MSPAAQALRARASRLADCEELAEPARQFWKGYAKAIDDLASGVGDALAAKDALGGVPPAGAGLSEDVSLLIVDGQSETAERVERSRDARTDDHVDRVEKLENPEVATLDIADEEHPTPCVDLQDDAAAHPASVSTGGAA